MSRTAEKGIELGELAIVDADSHVSQGAPELAPYIPDRYSGARKMIEISEHPQREIYSYGRASPPFANDSANVRNRGDFSNLRADTPEAKLDVMERFDIERTVLTPGQNVHLAGVNNDDAAAALATAYNDWVRETFLDADDSLFGTLSIAPQKPQEAAEEIERVADEPDVVGVQFPVAGLTPPAGHRQYLPIYEAAAKHDLPIVMHGGNSNSQGVFPVQRKWSETFLEDHAFTFPAGIMWQLITVVMRGIPERFPDLEFVLQEAGIAWLPWMMWRLDDHYLQVSFDAPALDKQPSEYIQEQFYVTTQPLGHTDNTRHMAMALELAGGADTVMFASDHPHPDFDTPEELFENLRSRFEPEEIRRMMGETAADVFGL